MINTEKKDRRSDNIIKATPPKKSETFTIRVLIVFGLVFLTLFLWWFFGKDRIGYAPLYWPLTIALCFKVLKQLHEWYFYWGISVPKMPESDKKWTVDILTTYCPGEPKEMILNTLKAMQDISYPHTSYLCDEGDDPELKKACEEMGVVHVTRIEKKDAKAGNINNALKQATGEICVIMDPDHVPVPEFLDRVLPYFEDPQLGYVQVVQAYGNHKESFVALGAAEQTYHFYGPMMMAMNTYGTTQAIGANCTFRRSALDSIGGHSPGLAEDMHTSMQLQAKGWKSKYVPEILSRGLVPSTLSGYYKQQLKWARGVFDLLFYVYPSLFSKFTWRQKIHYLTVPLYFFFGVVTLIDILIPIVALSLSEVPWLVEFSEFTLMFIPVLAMNLLIRQYSQRWLLEKHERGFHLVGGLLRIATWWIFVIGFIYTIFKIKVPYIPTPKDDKPENCWRLCTPNIVVCILSLAAITYGLSIDFNPYSFFMASFAMTNVLILGFMVLMSQQKMIINLYNRIKDSTLLYSYIWLYRIYLWKTRHGVYNVIRSGSVYFALAGVFFFMFSYTLVDQNQLKLEDLSSKKMKYSGGFYTGVYTPAIDTDFNIRHVKKIETSLNTKFDVVSFYQSWGTESLDKFPIAFLRDISKKGGVPMITWEPWSSSFAEFKDHKELSVDKNICAYICNGKFDGYIEKYALQIRKYGEPIFIRFAHEPGNPAYPWASATENNPEEYKCAWRHVVKKFEEQGVSNVTWVWNPWHSDLLHTYYPGDKYVDWIGLTTLNYGYASYDGKWKGFREMYEPYMKVLDSLNKPIMLAEFGSTPYGGDQAVWLDNSLNQVKTLYPEIKSVVFFNNDSDKNWITDWRPSEDTEYIDWTFNDDSTARKFVKMHIAGAPFNENPLKRANKPFDFNKAPKSYQSKFVKGKQGSYELIVNGQPLYVKGVVYNPSHDWRDEKIPLTRKRVSEDFEMIKGMGANVIRRYDPGAYDDNILNIAEEKDLKVIYGFWFDPKVDYYNDSKQVDKYINDVLSKVNEYKDHRAVMAWSIGNETWGFLKYEYSKPYLTLVRRDYVKMIEHLAQRIHEIDPSRPVFTVSEHEESQLPGELSAFRDAAPSLDLVAVNSFYVQQLSKLQELSTRFNPDRPYMVSEFGPRGYWHPEYSRLKDGDIIIEDSEFEKAILYASEWEKYIAATKGYNVGGVAYCWRDRLEGTATWYGITDYKGRLKPTYYALQKAWTGKSEEITMHNLYIIGPTEGLKGGNDYEFKAVTDNNLKKKIKYEWFLRREEYLEFVGDIEEIGNGQKVKVHVPNTPSNYRLYLYVSDEDGNVVTASKPLPIH